MAFDTTQPTDTTKLRLVGNVIRPNWVAIEDGESTFKPKAINLNNRTVSGPSNDPTAIADTFILYSKEDGGGNPELYGINENSDVIQFSLGVPSGTTTGISFLPGPTAGAFKIAWGNITITTSPSSTIAPTGFTTVYQYYMTVVGNTADTFATEGVAANSFRIIRGSGTSATIIRWLAIGV